jgi:hypothetical protein
VVVLVAYALVALSGPSNFDAEAAAAVPASDRATAGPLPHGAAGLIALYGLYLIVAADGCRAEPVSPRGVHRCGSSVARILGIVHRMPAYSQN